MRDIAGVAVKPDEQGFGRVGRLLETGDIPAMQRTAVSPPEPHLFVKKVIRRRGSVNDKVRMKRQRVFQPFDRRSQNRSGHDSQRRPAKHVVGHVFLSSAMSFQRSAFSNGTLSYVFSAVAKPRVSACSVILPRLAQG